MKKMLKANRFIKLGCVFVLALFMTVTAVACNQTQTYTMSFVAEGVDIAPIVAEAGAQITPPSDPVKENCTFEGWFDNAKFEGEPVQLPTVMPAKNVTYYAKFSEPMGSIKVYYDFNLPTASHTGELSPSHGEPGDTITVKDGRAYNAEGWLFIGWSTSKDGLVSQFGNKIDGQYLAGDSLVLGDKDITLYAQWAFEVTDAREQSTDKLYLYFEYIGKGNGAIILVREGKPNKLGFVSQRADASDDYYEFEFYFGEEDDYGVVGVVNGRLYDDNTYAFSDGLKGSFLYYDYVTKSYDTYVLTADGFGEAIVSQVIYDQIKTVSYGRYVYDSKYGDYTFTCVNPDTGEDIPDGDKPMQSIMSIELGAPDVNMEDNQFIGCFTFLGMESGSYLWYDNGELLNYRLDLNGYGLAKWYSYDAVNDVTSLIATGEYFGTDKYESEYGEWTFVASDNSERFNFIINMIQDPTSGNVPVYIEYNADMNLTLTGADGSALYLDGYGSAQYSAAGGMSYVGYFTISSTGNLLTYVPYAEGPDETVTAGGKMFFNVDWTDKTFTVSTTGYILDGTTLVSYQGESKIIVIPDGVTAIADNVFNYVNTDVSILSVVIPSSVTSIGSRAFQNEYTLRRVVFMSETPIEIDWSKENDPFRWGGAGTIIVVPEGFQDAYKNAWTDCPYTIKGSVEVTLLPEFEIVDGVLVRYNVQPDAPEALELVIPDEVTAIAENVFRGLAELKSVDLNRVMTIGEGAFELCVNLESVIFTNVTVIGDGAFAGCEKLSTATDGVIELNSVEEIGIGAFQSCYGLLRVRIGANIKKIGAAAFMETNMQLEHGPLFIELLGENAPIMGEKVFSGNIATRIKVNDINVAIKCFEESTFAAYNRHLYIESGDEKGLYLDGTDPLELDGRAFLLSTYVMMYKIDGEAITFYEYDLETARYYQVEGTIKDGIITVTIGSTTYEFIKVTGEMTYRSADGNYTLKCNPVDLLPETYEDNGYAGYADVTLNGTPAKMYISGYGIKKISMFLDSDGKYYDFNFSIVGTTLEYKKTAAEIRLTVSAADGSSLTLHNTPNFTYIYGKLNIVVGQDDKGKDIMMPDNGDYGVYATDINGNSYTFERIYKDKKFIITIVLSADKTTFTYTYSQTSVA